jgi:hypothetical protein
MNAWRRTFYHALGGCFRMGRGQMLESSEGRFVAEALENAPVGLMLCEADGGRAAVNLRLSGSLGR